MTQSLALTIEFLQKTIKSWNFSTRPLIIAISGPQGSGKSYISDQLYNHYTTTRPELNTINISIDDFYLTNNEQVKLTQSTKNPLLKGRGLPGTHDIELLFNNLSKLINKESGFDIPTYEKSLFSGNGDRASKQNWIKIKNDKPADIVIFEGWFVGFQPLENEEIFNSRIQNSQLLKNYNKYDLTEINSLLDQYQKVWSLFDLGVIFATDDIHNVYKWRIEQEHDLIQKKGEGMNDELVKKFVDRYMTVYELYYKDFINSGFRKLKDDGNFRIEIDSSRNVVNTSVINSTIDSTHHSIF